VLYELVLGGSAAATGAAAAGRAPALAGERVATACDRRGVVWRKRRLPRTRCSTNLRAALTAAAVVPEAGTGIKAVAAPDRSRDFVAPAPNTEAIAIVATAAAATASPTVLAPLPDPQRRACSQMASRIFRA
jgi:hypothetical protein